MKIKLKTKEWKEGYDVGFEAGKIYSKNLPKKPWVCECGAENSSVFVKCGSCGKEMTEPTKKSLNSNEETPQEDCMEISKQALKREEAEEFARTLC